MGADGVAGGGGVEDGEVDVGVGVCGVKEAAAAYRFVGLPELENSVDVDQMFEETPILVPALACAD